MQSAFLDLSISPLPTHGQRSLMEKNVATFHAMHRELIGQYLGQYVAICDGKMVDHDAAPILLMEHIRRDYPQQIVLRRKVEKVAERELRIRHPQFERMP